MRHEIPIRAGEAARRPRARPAIGLAPFLVLTAASTGIGVGTAANVPRRAAADAPVAAPAGPTGTANGTAEADATTVGTTATAVGGTTSDGRPATGGTAVSLLAGSVMPAVVDAGGTVSPAVAVNLSTTYPPTPAAYPIDARVVDSTGSRSTKRGVATVLATASDAARSGTEGSRGSPLVTDFELNATERNVDVVVSSTEDLEKLEV